MPKRKQKIYSKPKKPYDKARIEKENVLVAKYGLKNKREIWKADFAIEKIRNRAKKLITASEEEKQEFVKKQKAKGFEVETIAEVLSLEKEDYLKRRLQSIVVKKKLATTHKQARQFITHRHITINKKIIDSPAHLTTLEEEASVELKLALPAKKSLTKQEKEIIKEIKAKAPEPKKEESKEEEKPEEE